jgi:hypothetical protein
VKVESTLNPTPNDRPTIFFGAIPSSQVEQLTTIFRCIDDVKMELDLRARGWEGMNKWVKSDMEVPFFKHI